MTEGGYIGMERERKKGRKKDRNREIKGGRKEQRQERGGQGKK